MTASTVIKFVSVDVNGVGIGRGEGLEGGCHGCSVHTQLFLLTEFFSPAYHDGIGAADTNHTHVVNERYNTLILISQIFITLSHLQAFEYGIPSAQSAILSPPLEVSLYKPNSN